MVTFTTLLCKALDFPMTCNSSLVCLKNRWKFMLTLLLTLLGFKHFLNFLHGLLTFICEHLDHKELLRRFNVTSFCIWGDWGPVRLKWMTMLHWELLISCVWNPYLLHDAFDYILLHSKTWAKDLVPLLPKNIFLKHSNCIFSSVKYSLLNITVL